MHRDGVDVRYMCMTDLDLQNIYKAFKSCETARTGLLDLIDSVNTK